MRRYSRPRSSPHLHCQSPIEYLTKSSEQVSRKSENGKIEVNTACRPWLIRLSGSRFICRKRSYERRCTSIRSGIESEVRIFEKSTRPLPLPFPLPPCPLPLSCALVMWSPSEFVAAAESKPRAAGGKRSEAQTKLDRAKHRSRAPNDTAP